MSREVVEDELRGRTPRIDSRITPRGQFSVATKKAGETGMTRLAKSLSNINTGLAQYAALSKEEEERGKTIGEEIATSKANLQNIEKEILADEKRLLEQGILRKHQLLGFRKAYYKTGGQRAALEAQNKLRARYKDARINLDDPNFNGESIVEEVYGEFKAQYGENTDFMSGFNPKFDNISAFWMSNFDQIRQKELDRKHIRDVQQVVTLNLEGGAESALEIMNSTADPFMPVDTKIKTFFSGIETYASNVYETKTTAEATAEIDKLMDELETTSTPELGELKNLEGFTALRSRIQNISRRAEDANDEREQKIARNLPGNMVVVKNLLDVGDLEGAISIVESLHTELREPFEQWLEETEGTRKDVIGDFYFTALQDLDLLGIYADASLAAGEKIRSELYRVPTSEPEFDDLMENVFAEQLRAGVGVQALISTYNLKPEQQQQLTNLAVDISIEDEGIDDAGRYSNVSINKGIFEDTLASIDPQYKDARDLSPADDSFILDLARSYSSEFETSVAAKIRESNIRLKGVPEEERQAARTKIFEEENDRLQKKYQEQIQERLKLNTTIRSLQTVEPVAPDLPTIRESLSSFYTEFLRDPRVIEAGLVETASIEGDSLVTSVLKPDKDNILLRLSEDENWKNLEEIDAALNNIEAAFPGSVPDSETAQEGDATALLKAYRTSFGYEDPIFYDPFLLDGKVVRVFKNKAMVDDWMRVIQSKETSVKADAYRNVLRVKFGLEEDAAILSFLDKQAQILDIFE